MDFSLDDTKRVSTIYAKHFGRCLGFKPNQPAILHLDRFQNGNLYASPVSRANSSLWDQFIIFESKPTKPTDKYDWQCGVRSVLLELLHRRSGKPIICLWPDAIQLASVSRLEELSQSYDFIMRTYVMDIFGKTTKLAVRHYPSKPFGENTAAIIMSGSYPLVERKYLIFTVFDPNIWLVMFNIICLIGVLIKICLVVRSIGPNS